MSLEPTGVLDTSALILLDGFPDETGLPTVPAITTVALAELGAGPLVASDEGERAIRQSHLQSAEGDIDPIPTPPRPAPSPGRPPTCARPAASPPRAASTP